MAAPIKPLHDPERGEANRFTRPSQLLTWLTSPFVVGHIDRRGQLVWIAEAWRRVRQWHRPPQGLPSDWRGVTGRVGYRTATVTASYESDSTINSLGDVLSFVAGSQPHAEPFRHDWRVYREIERLPQKVDCDGVEGSNVLLPFGAERLRAADHRD